jgi:SAM-dependent methyltransferase
MDDRSSQSLDPAIFFHMWQLINGYRTTQAIYVSAKLGIAELLDQTPQSADELALATKTHAPSLRRLLLMLASVGIFAEDPAGKFRHTSLSEILRRKDPLSIRDFAIMSGSEFFWRPWGELYESVRTGQPAFDQVHAAPAFQYFTAHSDHAAIFNGAMTSLSSWLCGMLVQAYDFARFDRIVDLGGGRGGLLHAILSANPKLHGVLADLPAVVADAASLQEPAIAGRCEIVAVDFFDSVPEGADGYIMKNVIHDWNDVDGLKNCRRAIRPDGKLLLCEAALKASNQPDPARSSDLNMLVMLGGRERTVGEYQVLLADAGFSLTRVISTASPMSIIESQPT